MATDDDGKKGSGMNTEPVSIFRGTERGEIPVDVPEGYTPEQATAWLNAQHTRRIQTGFFLFLGIVALGLLTPLVIWLSRMAGGW